MLPRPPEFNPVFYIAARIHGVFRPLAVVSQIPTSSRAAMKLSKAMITATSRFIHFRLSDQTHYCALRAELAAAAAIYGDGDGPTREPLPKVEGRENDFERPQDVDLKSTLFPFTTATLLGSLARGKKWHKERNLMDSDYWSQLPLGTCFDKEDSENLAVVFDVTDPNAVVCSMLSWEYRQAAEPMGHVVTVPESHEWCPVIEITPAFQFLPKQILPRPVYRLESGDILHMLWDLPNKPVPNRNRVKSLIELSMCTMVKGGDQVGDFGAANLQVCQGLPGFQTNLEKALAESASANTLPDAMVQFLINAFKGQPHVYLVPILGISCATLTTALAAPELRGIETLSFTAYTLIHGTDNTMDALLRVLHDLPSLRSVYVADMRGRPTVESRADVKDAQYDFLQRAEALFSPDWAKKKLDFSATYIAQLRGRSNGFMHPM